MRSRLKPFSVPCIALGISGLFASYSAKQAQYSDEQQLVTGSVLLADERLSDPNFAHAVVLIVQFNSGSGTEGVIINRQTETAISGIFPKVKHPLKDPVYLGGPVQITGVQALARLPESAVHAVHVVDDIYLAASKELIEKSINAQADSSKFRLYIGYAGWASGQLEAEIQLGAWSVVKGNSKIIFDPHPDSLWLRLTRESRMPRSVASDAFQMPLLTAGRASHDLLQHLRNGS